MQKLNKTVIYKIMVIGLSGGLTLPAIADLGIVSKLVNNGVATTQATLGHMYLNGDGISQDDINAFEKTKEAAYRGRVFSQYTLGEMYSNGIGVRQNYTKAAEWFEKSANQGNSDAQYMLGVMYYEGEGVSQDYSKAAQWIEKSTIQIF